MKVCFIAPKAYQLFNPEVKSTFGGAEVQLNMLAKELATLPDLEVHFIVADYGQREKELHGGVVVWKSFNFNEGILKRTGRFYKVFRRVDSDVYIQRTLTVQSGLIALYCRLKRRKFVYMVAHDGETDGSHELFKSILARLLIRVNFTLASVVFVQNEYEKQHLLERYKIKSLHILKKGIDLSNLANTPKMEANGKTYDGIWVGRCDTWKRPELFLKLAENNPDKKFIIICPPATKKDEYFTLIKNQAQTLKNLEFVDFSTQKDVYSYLAKSKVFCFTSEKEGDWPMVVLEAAAAGLPVLSYSINYDKLIDEYQGGLYCRGSIENMSEQLNALCHNQVLCDTIGKNARRYVSENHDIGANTNHFSSIIQNLVQDK